MSVQNEKDDTMTIFDETEDTRAVTVSLPTSAVKWYAVRGRLNFREAKNEMAYALVKNAERATMQASPEIKQKLLARFHRDETLNDRIVRLLNKWQRQSAKDLGNRMRYATISDIETALTYLVHEGVVIAERMPTGTMRYSLSQKEQ